VAKTTHRPITKAEYRTEIFQFNRLSCKDLQMKASVIIPCYNAEKTLPEQLEAISRQQWSEEWEIILVDNGSTDNSLNVARQYSSKLSNLKIIQAADVKGPAHARNRGAEVAKGESLLFCDADDEVAFGWVAAMGNALKQHDFIACRMEPLKLSLSWAVKARECPQQKGLEPYKYPSFLPHAGGGGLGIKRRIHEAVGGFDETMPLLEDTDYCWRVQLAGTKLVFVPDALIHIRLRGSMRTMFRQSRLWGEYNVYLYKKYRPHGMPDLSAKVGLSRTWKLLRQMPYCLRNSDKRQGWLRRFAWQYGRAIGSIKHGVFAL
jgi:glycosyltransferase involved in cell wall biosynthesis